MKGNAFTVTVAPSRRLRWAVVALHLLAGTAVVLAELAWAYRLAVIVAVVFSLVVSIRQAGAVALRCETDGSLSMRLGEDWQPVELFPDTVALSWLVVLRYRCQGHSRSESRPILADSLDRDDFRRLRVWLRWRPGMAEVARK